VWVGVWVGVLVGVWCEGGGGCGGGCGWRPPRLHQMWLELRVFTLAYIKFVRDCASLLVVRAYVYMCGYVSVWLCLHSWLCLEFAWLCLSVVVFRAYTWLVYIWHVCICTAVAFALTHVVQICVSLHVVRAYTCLHQMLLELV
jgi:hypothetical protein